MSVCVNDLEKVGKKGASEWQAREGKTRGKHPNGLLATSFAAIRHNSIIFVMQIEAQQRRGTLATGIQMIPARWSQQKI